MRKLLLVIAGIFTLSVSQAAVTDSVPPRLSSRFLVFPFFLRSPETKWGFGGAGAFFFKVKNDDHFSRTSDVSLVALYTLREQVVLVLNSTIFFPDEKNIFRFQGSYSYYPDKFWGLGNNTDESAEENYSLKQTFITPQLLFKLYRRFYIGTTLELQRVRDFKFNAGGVFDQNSIVGKNGGFTGGAGILLTFDSRTNAYSPDKGSFAEINMTRFSNVLGSDFEFTSYSLDIRTFFKAGKNRVLGLHSLSRFNAGEPPIRYMSALGGSEIMRGYFKGRYTDRHLVAFQAELRQFLFWRLGITAFAGAGQVGRTIDDFGFNELHYSYGGGLRLMVQKKEKLNLRVDFGFGENSSGIYVILKEAF